MNIYESITQIMTEVPGIEKKKKNQQQGFMYRGIDDVMNALQPLLAKNKVFIVPEILEQTREERVSKQGANLIYSICRIKYKFYAEDGTSIEAVTIGEGMDSGDKATNKAMAIAMKYALFQVFCIPTEDMKDPDGETPPESEPIVPTINEAMYAATMSIINEKKLSNETVIKILEKNGYKKLKDIEIKDIVKIQEELKKGI